MKISFRCLVCCMIVLSSVAKSPKKTQQADDNGEEKAFIIGGSEATPGAWPWQVVVRRYGSFICGGTLINPSTVVTAAHCVDTGSAYTYQYDVAVGDTNFLVNEGTEQIKKIRSIVVHPTWDRNTVTNDIAVLLLSSPVIVNPTVKPIDMITKSITFNSTSECYITGYGMTRILGEQGSPTYTVNGEYPEKLMEVRIALFPDDTCSLMMSTKFSESNICLYEPSNNKGSCYGDSGGPLVCKDNGRFLFVGVTSFGYTSCDGPSIYTEVSYYLDWIDMVIKNQAVRVTTTPTPVKWKGWMRRVRNKLRG